MTLKRQTDLTEKQKSTLAYIFNCGKKAKRKLDACVHGTDGEREKLSANYEKYKQAFADVYTAKEQYDEHIRLADYHITQAENLKKEWEF